MVYWTLLLSLLVGSTCAKCLGGGCDTETQNGGRNRGPFIGISSGRSTNDYRGDHSGGIAVTRSPIGYGRSSTPSFRPLRPNIPAISTNRPVIPAITTFRPVVPSITTPRPILTTEYYGDDHRNSDHANRHHNRYGIRQHGSVNNGLGHVNNHHGVGHNVDGYGNGHHSAVHQDSHSDNGHYGGGHDIGRHDDRHNVRDQLGGYPNDINFVGSNNVNSNGVFDVESGGRHGESSYSDYDDILLNGFDHRGTNSHRVYNEGHQGSIGGNSIISNGIISNGIIPVNDIRGVNSNGYSTGNNINNFHSNDNGYSDNSNRPFINNNDHHFDTNDNSFHSNSRGTFGQFNNNHRGSGFVGNIPTNINQGFEVSNENSYQGNGISGPSQSSMFLPGSGFVRIDPFLNGDFQRGNNQRNHVHGDFAFNNNNINNGRFTGHGVNTGFGFPGTNTNGINDFKPSIINNRPSHGIPLFPVGNPSMEAFGSYYNGGMPINNGFSDTHRGFIPWSNKNNIQVNNNPILNNDYLPPARPPVIRNGYLPPGGK